MHFSPDRLRIAFLSSLLATLVAVLGASAPVQASPAPADSIVSHLAIYDMAADTTRTVYSAHAHFEAPNWSRDGSFLIFNQEGRLYRIPVSGGSPTEIPTGSLESLNNDHGISPDGSTLAVTNGDGHIYTLPIEGGTPTRVTQKTPSYWHGWSPDGGTLAYVGLRNGMYDLFTIPVDGGPETQLTADEAHDDGPDYSPDGEYIYFNSHRSETFDIWRMPATGGDAEQITDDRYEDWFPHPSPDGEHIVLLSYAPGTDGHPANRDVRLRLMGPDGENLSTIVELFGGQGTINVPSWSPDSDAFAFVYYEIDRSGQSR